MYNEERPSFRGLIVKILIVIIFIFLLMWLFPFPKMTPVYDRLFKDNIDSMKDAAKGYFNINRMPKTIGDKQSITLSEMIQQKMILPLIDSEGKTCDGNSSYVEVTKMDNEYLMKINLSCPTKSDYIVEHIGCNDFCDNCKPQKEIKYQFYRTLYQGYKVVNGKVLEYEFIKYGYNITNKYYCIGDSKPIEGDQTHCLVTDHWVDTKPKTTTTEKVDAEKTTTKVFDYWKYGEWQPYDTISSRTPLSIYPNTYDSGTKMRKYVGKYTIPASCTGCSSILYYQYDLYKRTRTAIYKYVPGYKACVDPLKPITGDLAHCLKITTVCDTANGYREDPNNKNSCIKDMYGSHKVDAKKEEVKTSYVLETIWSTSKTLSGYEATGGTRTKYVYHSKIYSGWLPKLPKGYIKSGEKKVYTWSKFNHLNGWQLVIRTK